MRLTTVILPVVLQIIMQMALVVSAATGAALPVTGTASAVVVVSVVIIPIAIGIHGAVATVQHQRHKRAHRHHGVLLLYLPTQLKYHGKTIKP